MRSVLDFTSAVVVIVKYAQPERVFVHPDGNVMKTIVEPETPKPGKFYSVSITPERKQQISPSREFIRFGDVFGDELVGWQRVSDLEVCEVVAWYDKGERIVCQGKSEGEQAFANGPDDSVLRAPWVDGEEAA